MAEERPARGSQAVRFLDSLSAGKPTTAPATAPGTYETTLPRHVRPSTLMAVEMAASRGGCVSTSGFLDAKGTRVARSYGVERLIKNEDLATRLKGPIGAPTAWRKSTELEHRLELAEREKAASTLQVEQLRAENRRKGSRIGQLEKLIALLEEHNRSLEGRLRSLDSDGLDGRVPEPLPASAAEELDSAVATAVMHSRSARLRRSNAYRRQRRRRKKRRERGGEAGFSEWVGGGDRGAWAAAQAEAGWEEGEEDEEDEDEDAAEMEEEDADEEEMPDATDVERAASHPVGPLVWRATRWVDSLGMSALVARCLMRHLKAKSSAPSAELAFVGSLGEVASRVTVMAALKEGALLERLATSIHAGSVRVANERRIHVGTTKLPALESIHPLRLHCLQHKESDIAPTPPAHSWLIRTVRRAEALVSGHAEEGVGAAAAPGEREEEAEIAIRMEHTSRADARANFDSAELATPTFAACEYWFVMDPQTGLRTLGITEWPGTYVPLPSRRNRSQTAAAWREEHSQRRAMARKPKPWSSVEPHVRTINDRLLRVGVQPLTKAEAIAARLATGPMASKYDALLKYASSPSPEAKAYCDELCMGNGYQSTLANLVGALKRLSRLHTSSSPIYRCVSAETAAAVWRSASSAVTSSSGLLTCVVERSAAVIAAAHLAASGLVPSAEIHANLGDKPKAVSDRAAANKRQYWSAYRGALNEIAAATGGARSDEDEEGDGESALPDLPAGVIDRSNAGGRDGAALIRIDPIANALGGKDGGACLVADLNFLSQRPMAECRDVVMVPLSPLQVTSMHVEGSVLVLNAIAGRAADLTSRLPHPFSAPTSHAALAVGAAAAAAQASVQASVSQFASASAATSMHLQAPAMLPPPVAPSAVTEAPPPTTKAAAASKFDEEDHIEIRTVREAAGLGKMMPGAPDSLHDHVNGLLVPGASTGGTSKDLRRLADPLAEAVYVGCPFVASKSLDNPRRCFFWFHLPEATGGVEMRYRRVGDTHWTAHEVAVQVLPGGWWRTGEWKHAGDIGYEQGCWVHEQVVMCGILGPSEGHLLDALEQGTSPPSPNGIGSDGKGIVHVRNGRIVTRAEELAEERQANETADEKKQALDAIFSSTASAAGSTAAATSAAGGGENAFARLARSGELGDVGNLGEIGESGSVAGSMAASVPPLSSARPPLSSRGTRAAGTPTTFTADGGMGAEPALPGDWGGEVEWNGTGVVIGTGPSAAKDASSRMAKLVAALWYAPSPSDQRMLERSDISVERMTWNGLRYVRIWSLRAPARGSSGGGFDLPVEMIEQLAAAANTIHIRIKGDENQSVTLKPGVEWPLQQLRRGMPFDTTLHGVDVTPAIARVTWTSVGGDKFIEAMWNKGASRHRESNTLRQGRLYLGCGNPHGLHLLAGSRCELHAGSPAPVEVWLGKVPLPN